MSTDPADVSVHSLDDSVKSFGSTRSLKSNKSIKSQGSVGKSSAKSNGKSIGTHGYSSGTDIDTAGNLSGGDAASTGSGEGSTGMRRNPKSLIGHSSSIIGLDSMIENRREEGNLQTNMVHMEVPFGKPIEEVYDGVHTGPVLGSGISGLVRLVTHKATGVKYAVKCLDLGLVDTTEGLAQLREEIFIMCQLDHPNIVRLEEVYESHAEIYLVQELCFGGELFDRLDEQPDYHYTEGECARLIKQMLCAVRYLHSKGIIHRDLKLENFLFSSTAADSELKMIDFGLSKHFRYGEVQHDAVGTPYTVSPEVIRGSYDERCDIWAIGVISFLLLSGEPPFGGCGGPEPLKTVRANILSGHYSFEPADIWDLVSQGARVFIIGLLVVDPKNRPTAREAQKHPWLEDWANRTRAEGDNVLNPNVVKALVNFKEFSDMRKLLCEVLSFTLLPDQITDLRKEFEKMDTDGSGEISLAALKEVLVTNAGAGSLGALTEEEVEDIFNAMRVKKTETRIHWHEFIAAGLSQCQVDERNLRLAFDRLDNDHKGVSSILLPSCGVGTRQNSLVYSLFSTST
jgi:calcium-dependent protein kinase